MKLAFNGPSTERAPQAPADRSEDQKPGGSEQTFCHFLKIEKANEKNVSNIVFRRFLSVKKSYVSGKTSGDRSIFRVVYGT